MSSPFHRAAALVEPLARTASFAPPARDPFATILPSNPLVRRPSGLAALAIAFAYAEVASTSPTLPAPRSNAVPTLPVPSTAAVPTLPAPRSSRPTLPAPSSATAMAREVA